MAKGVPRHAEALANACRVHLDKVRIGLDVCLNAAG
jgi:hypothetical protein